VKRDADSDRRSGRERRQKHIPFYKFLFFQGNRKVLRRSDDGKQITMFDQYHPSLLLGILIVLCLSLVDAALTLLLLDRGAVELNPLMKFYIELGPGTFVIVKYGLTALGLFIIVILNAIISARYRIGLFVIPFCALMFGSVIIWELYLLTKQL